MKETNKLILVAVIPSIISLMFGVIASPILESVGKNIADFFFPPNKVPIAQAEPINKTILEGNNFTLTASGSNDPDGDNIVSYKWQQINENGIFATPVSNIDRSEVIFTAPNVINDVDLSFQLIVEDNEGTTNNDTAKVTVKSKHPFKKEWGGNEHFNLTQGIAAEQGYGNVFVVDKNNNRIQMFDHDGNFILQWGGKGTEEGLFQTPEGIAVDPNIERGYIFVADSGNNRVQKFADWIENLTSWGTFCNLKTNIGCVDPDGTGSLESGDGQFHYPQGVAVDKDGNVYVADSSNHRIQKFDTNGTFLTKWGSSCILRMQTGCVDPDGNGPLESGDGQFFAPIGIAVNSQTAEIFVVDKLNNRIQKFDANGTFMTKWNNTEDGRFDPEYIAVDQRTGKVYVTDKRYHRVDEFDANGTFVSYWDADNSLFANPVGIAVAPLDPKIYVTDDATNTIKIFALNPD